MRLLLSKLKLLRASSPACTVPVPSLQGARHAACQCRAAGGGSSSSSARRGSSSCHPRQADGGAAGAGAAPEEHVHRSAGCLHSRVGLLHCERHGSFMCCTAPHQTCASQTVAYGHAHTPLPLSCLPLYHHLPTPYSSLPFPLQASTTPPCPSPPAWLSPRWRAACASAAARSSCCPRAER